MLELTKSEKTMVSHEMHKIVAIQEYLHSCGISGDNVRDYALVIYNRCGGDISGIDKD